MSRPIWISNGGNLSFQEVIASEDKYVDHWMTIVRHWIFEPCQNLARDRHVTDRGMALLMMELAFFEPLGSIITGEDSDGKGRKTFSIGLREFANWLFAKNAIGSTERAIISAGAEDKEPSIVYSLARCGLMHNMTMKGGQIFIDALGIGEYCITDYTYQMNHQSKGGAIIEGESILLFDPWRLLPEMEQFLRFFAANLRELGNDSIEYRNFKSTFERNIVRPGKVYLDMMLS